MTYRRTSTVTRGAFASRPSPGIPGNIYLTNDSPFLFIDDGSTWQRYLLSYPLSAGDLSTSGYTQYNAGGRATTFSATKSALLMLATNGANATDIRLATKTAPGTPYTYTVHLLPTLQQLNYSWCGIVWRNSTSGNVILFGFGTNASLVHPLIVRRLTANNNSTSPTYTFSADSITVNPYPELLQGNGVWMRLTDNGTNRITEISNDGFNWMTIFTEGRTTFITADEIGIWISPRVDPSGSTSTLATCLFTSIQ